MPDQDQLIISIDVYPHKKNLYASTLSLNIGLSRILNSDWSKGSFTIKQNLRTLPGMVIGIGNQVSQ